LKKAEIIHAIEAERAVLGCVLMQPDLAGPVCELLRPGYFIEKLSGTVMRHLAPPCDIVIVQQRIINTPRDKELMGGSVKATDYLVMLADQVPTPTHWREYARLVFTACVSRRLIQYGNELVSDCTASPAQPEDALRALQPKLAKVAEHIREFKEGIKQ